MATESLVIDLKESGQLLLNELREGGFDVTVAAWLHVSIEERWIFYIASTDVDDDGKTTAYRRLHAAISDNVRSWVLETSIRLIRTDDPVAVDALELRRKTPANIPINFGGRTLGGKTIDAAYIYPA
ncbi:MAG: hypothetical protein KDA63_16740 [Planctomycetales bacterium]|nr:hypothetical protein [Planctomycetales bacterium]